MDSEAPPSYWLGSRDGTMKAIGRRLMKLEQRHMPQGHNAGPTKAEILRARYRRRLEASGEPCVPLPPGNDLAGKSIAEMLRCRFCGGRLFRFESPVTSASPPVLKSKKQQSWRRI